MADATGTGRATRPPRFGAQAIFGTLGQLTQGIVGLSLLLVGHEAHLPVTVSALAVSAYAVGMAIGRPVQGRAIDTVSPPVILAGCGGAHGLAFVLVAVAAHQRWTAGLVAAGLVAGLSLPPVATQMRSSWPRSVVPERATSMFAVISSLQTASVLGGPVVFTVVAALSSATAGMLTVAGVAAVTTVLFALATGAVVDGAGGAARVRLRHYLVPLLLTGALGLVNGTIEVTAPAVAIGAGHPGVAGLLVATATLGTLLGGLAAMRWGGRTARVLEAGAALQVCGCLLLLVPASLVVAAGALFVIGAGITPAYAALSALVGERAGGTAESFGWQSTALGLGVAGGSAVAGALIDPLGAHGSVTVAGLAALALLVGAAARSRVVSPAR